MTDMTKTETPCVEWSHLFAVSTLDDTKIKCSISPETDDYEGLARRIHVTALNSLNADLEIERVAGSATIHIQGELQAKITQECVVTAEAIESDIVERFEAWYGEENSAVSLTKKRQEKMLAKGQTEIPLVEEHDDPEPVIDGMIDLSTVPARSTPRTSS